MAEKYIRLEDMCVYKISLELCDLAWELYAPMHWRDKKTMGDQFIRSIDSNAANIAEGYGRFHYLDRIKFYYNARASLMEAKHWARLLDKRQIITAPQSKQFLSKSEQTHYQLNRWISVAYKQKDRQNYQ